jgi:hypothetical protein
VKARPRRRDGAPGGGEAQEGIGRRSRLNPADDATDPGVEQTLKAGEGAWRTAGNRRAASRSQRHEGTGRRRGGTATPGGNPLKSRTLDVAAGRNKPARPVAEQAVVDVRNVVDGTVWDLGIPHLWTPPVDVAKRAGTPRKELRRTAATGQARVGSTLQGSKSSREDEPISQEMGDGARRKTAWRTGNGGRWRVRGTRCPRWSRAYNTPQG